MWGVPALGASVPCGGGAGAPPFAGPASSLKSGQSGGVGRSWGASRGAAWYWGGGEVPCSPWIRHVGVCWRQRLVVWVE